MTVPKLAPIDQNAIRLALDMMNKYRLGWKRLADTPFAATLSANGMKELITCNPSDYEALPDLSLIDPLA